jgi:hypothetical protein
MENFGICLILFSFVTLVCCEESVRLCMKNVFSSAPPSRLEHFSCIVFMFFEI